MLAWAQEGARTPTLGLKYTSDQKLNDNFVKLDTLAATGTTWRRTPATTVTCPSVGGGGASCTLTPTSSLVFYVCGDTGGCTLTLSETGAVTGTFVTIVRDTTSTGSLVFATISGVQVASATFVMAQAYDNFTVLYAGDRWIEVAKGNL